MRKFRVEICSCISLIGNEKEKEREREVKCKDFGLNLWGNYWSLENLYNVTVFYVYNGSQGWTKYQSKRPEGKRERKREREGEIPWLNFIYHPSLLFCPDIVLQTRRIIATKFARKSVLHLPRKFNDIYIHHTETNTWWW